MSSTRVEVPACRQCGLPFRGYAGNPNKFCSVQCRSAWRKTNRPSERRCARCKETLPVSSFGSFIRADRDGRRFYDSYCKPCRRASVDSATTRRYSLKKRYGITPERFDEMLAEQGGGCASCGSNSPNGKYWHIDHDHSCCPSSSKTCGECIRSILCHGCNTALGNLGDDPARVAALLDYIRSHVGEHV